MRKHVLILEASVFSLFWWTNETINIWSHLLGWMFFLGLSIYDSMGLMTVPNTHPWDRAIVVMLLIAFQVEFLTFSHQFPCTEVQNRPQ